MMIKNKIWILFYFLERRVKEAAFLRNEEKKSAPVAIETRRDSAEYSDSINSLSSDDIVSTKNFQLKFRYLLYYIIYILWI